MSGRLRVPGDKSIAHRYALLAALAEGRSTVTGFAPGADCRSTLACLRGLGVEVVEGPAGTVTFLGRGSGQLRSPVSSLNAGNSGTTMRLLAGVLAGHPFSSRLVGDASLSSRPMRRVIAPLERMGARIDAKDGRPPLTIHGARLRGAAHRPETPSAQVKSAVLLAGLHAEGTTSVAEPAATRDHTERALTAFGGQVGVDGLTVSVTGGQLHGCTAVPVWARSRELLPPIFVCTATATGAATCHVVLTASGLGHGHPTRTALLDVLRRFGARVQAEITTTEAGEPRGIVSLEGDRMGTLEIAPEEVPGLIDELPAIAALAAHGGQVTVRGAGELRVKESDRIATLVGGFRSLGIDADEREDGFIVRGASTAAARPAGGTADARGDHRMAMAFAIAALAADGPSLIDGADVVGISYPGFFEALDRLVAPLDGLGAP